MEITPELTPSYRALFSELYAQIIDTDGIKTYRSSVNYDFIREVFDDLQSDLGDIRTWVADIKNWTISAASSAGSVASSVLNLMPSLPRLTLDFGAALLTGLSTLASFIWEKIKGFFEYIWTILQPIIYSVWQFFASLVVTVTDFIKNAWTKLSAWLGEAYTKITDFLAPVFDWLKSVLKGVWETIAQWASNFYDFFTKTLPDFFNSIITNGIEIFNLLKDVINEFAKWIWKHIKIVLDFIDNYTWAKYLVFVAAPSVAIVTYATGKLTEIYSHFKGEITKGIGIQPEDAPTMALAFLLFATGAGVAAHLAATSAEVFHPTHMIGLNYMAAILGDIASYSRIIAASVGVMVALSIRTPFEYYLKRLLRPILPREQELTNLVQRRAISEQDFRKNMTYHGYPDKWIDAFYKSAFREPRLTELSYVYEDGNISDDWLLKRILAYGIATEDADNFLKAINLRVMKTQRQDFYSATMKLYANGMIDSNQFDDNLELLELRKDAKEHARRAADLQYLYNKINDNVKLYVDTFKKDLISEFELGTALTGLGLNPDIVQDTVESAKIYKQPKPVKAVAAKVDTTYQTLVQKMLPLYLQQYRYELITKEVLNTKLTSLGLNTEYINLVISIEEAKKVKTATKVSSSAIAKKEKEIDDLYTKEYIAQFEDDLINEDQLTNSLTQLGISADIVKAKVAAEVAKKYEPETVQVDRSADLAYKELRKKYYDYYILAYRKGVIDDGQLTQGLLALDIPDDEVAITVQTEQIRKLNPPKAETTALIPQYAGT